MKTLLVSLLLLFNLQECESNNQTNTVKEIPSEELAKYETAYFASGCFWCVEAIYESLEGVKEVVSGYSGGKEKNPTYQQVGSHKTGHTEAVEVYYDPTVISFATLVKVFYGSQDPTTVGQQPDFGDSYRSVIFYKNAEEKTIADAAKAAIAKDYKKPIVTEIVPFEKFWKAEDYHQNYEKLNPNQPYVRSVSIPRLNRFKAKFPELLKEGE
ncbi:peptide-methionine (S)-S-oxide reductase MsrA [Arcticibacterium luteifluviistationis]|uniref:Peptide methionine sulfoxide reductase MsrA n=1 Tax=Arcticibacterium luteifluviistationis TaxID=1784714 RepID=A0A2Z4GCX5_9BACT|nr:peptide-methionine (S)-S-oxide reductase MsrA [Arcticibacterium luteifluviistationis]AWV98753.1 peptide-methionine (S)-S-oxide reductase [Arcticibacterium luteifluviistationis]